MYKLTETSTFLVRSEEQAEHIRKLYEDLQALIMCESFEMTSNVEEVVTQTRLAKWGVEDFKWIVAPSETEAKEWVRYTNYSGGYRIITRKHEVQGTRMNETNVVFVALHDIDRDLVEEVRDNKLRHV